MQRSVTVESHGQTESMCYWLNRKNSLARARADVARAPALGDFYGRRHVTKFIRRVGNKKQPLIKSDVTLEPGKTRTSVSGGEQANLSG